MDGSSRVSFITTEVDGVPLHHLQSGEPVCTATLIFGVGSRDESLPTQGVIHVLEHVVMDAAKSTTAEINASVGPSETEFTVSGLPPRVTEFLDLVCRGLADPPTAGLRAEAPIIAAETDGGGGPDHTLLAARYGFRDLGIPAMDAPGPDGLTEEQLRKVAASWFVAGNAALVVDGPLPPDLRLPLLAGQPPEHHRIRPRRWAGPHAIRIEAPACAVSILLPPQTTDRLDVLAIEVIELRLRETLRHRDGLTYLVEHTVHPVGDDRHDLLFFAEPTESRLAAAITALVAELRRLLREGASAAELELARARVSEGRLGRAGLLEERRVAVVDRLLGVSAFPIADDRLAEVNLAALNRYLAGLESDLLFLVADEPDLDLGRLDLPETTMEPTTTGDLPPGEVFRPPLLTQAFSSAARQATVVLTATGVAARLEGLIQRVDWDGVAGLVLDEEDLLLCGLDGAAIPLASSAYRRGHALVAQVRARVPDELTFRRSALLDNDVGR